MSHGGQGLDQQGPPSQASNDVQGGQHLQAQTQTQPQSHGFALPHERRDQQLQQQQQQQQQQPRPSAAGLPSLSNLTQAQGPSSYMSSFGAGQGQQPYPYPSQQMQQGHVQNGHAAQGMHARSPNMHQALPLHSQASYNNGQPVFNRENYMPPQEHRSYPPPQTYAMPLPFTMPNRMQSMQEPARFQEALMPMPSMNGHTGQNGFSLPKPSRKSSSVIAPPPDHSAVLGYDTKELQWNTSHTLNSQHKYCYCGKDRNLLDVDVSCWKCKNFFHGRCIRLNLGPVVPFLTNYQFTCKHCPESGTEDFKRLPASWRSVAATTLANLLLMRMRASNPLWEKHHYDATHVETLSQAEGWFLRKQDMVPFLSIPRHWAAICPDRAFESTWQSPLGVALSNSKELFRCFDEENRSANAHYTLLEGNLFMFRANYVHQIPKIPGQAKKRKADALEDGQVASPAGAVPGGPTELAANPPATNDAAPALERNQSDTSTNTMPLFSSAIPVKAGHVMPKEEPFIIPPERVSARASKPVVTSDPPTATPQKPTVDRALATPVADGPRERKPTAKKAAATAPRKDIVQAQQESVPSGNSVLRAAAGAFRFRPPPYKPGDLTASLRLPARIPVESANEETFYAMADLPFNKRGFRYSTCEAAPSMPSIMYRSVELPPHAARIDWSDMSQYVYLSRDALSATTDKGFRTARANVGAREGSWYWEVKVLCGNGDRGGHVRLGVARREATLDAPVGFDGYGYGLRDRGGEKMHLSRPRAFMDESFGTGDVIGFHLQLPPLPTNAAATASLVAMAQAKPKQSKSKKAGTSQGAQNTAQTVVRGAGGVAGLVSRERIPIRYRGQLYFEQLEYVGTREMEDRLNPATAAAAALSTSSSNKQLTSKPTFVPGTLEDPDAVLKGSSLVIYKNGKRMGTAFTDLLNFLPPFSQTSATQALATSSGNPIAAGTALAAADDGTLGYYPAISVFSGGAARFNFGPEFDFPPAVKDVKPMSERYAEQIAEDIVMDLLDEVDFGLMDEAMGYKPEPPAIPASDIGVLPGAIGTPDRDIMVAHEPIVDVKMEHAAQT